VAINLKSLPAKQGVIKQLRERKGWGQEFLATKAVISAKTLSSVEQGRPAQLSTLRKIAMALDVEPSVIIEGLDKSPGPVSKSRVHPMIDAIIGLLKDFAEFDETQDLLVILKYIAAKIRLQGELGAENVTDGSVRIHLHFSDEADVRSLVQEFCRLSFFDIKLFTIFVYSPLDLASLIAHSMHSDIYEHTHHTVESLETAIQNSSEEAKMFVVRGKIGVYFTVQRTPKGIWILHMTQPILEPTPLIVES